MSNTGTELKQSTDTQRNHTHLARRTALAFALFGALWVLTSDWVLVLFVRGPVQFYTWQTYKGWLFIGISALFIYGVLAGAERRRASAAAALIESEHHYRLLFASNPHPMWVYDVETLHFLEVNEAAVARYGFTREEFHTMTLYDIRPPEDAARLKTDTTSTIAKLNYAGEWRHRKKNGEIITVEIT